MRRVDLATMVALKSFDCVFLDIILSLPELRPFSKCHPELISWNLFWAIFTLLQKIYFIFLLEIWRRVKFTPIRLAPEQQQEWWLTFFVFNQRKRQARVQARARASSCRTCHRSPSKNVRLNFFLSHTWKKNLKHVSTRFRSRPTFLKKCLIHQSSFIFVRCRSTEHENSFEEFSWNENDFGAKVLLNISNLIHGQSVLFTITEVQ